MAGLNIFITGASGFIGNPVLKKIISKLDSDDKVFVLSRAVFDFEDKMIVVLRGDLENIEAYENEISESDYVYHLAANATFGSGCDYDKVNFFPTKKIVDILRRSKRIKNFIFTSTIGAVDRHKNDLCEKPLNANSIPAPTSAYGKSKLKSEDYIKQSGIPFTILRPTWVYGPNMRSNSHLNKFVSMLYEKRDFIFKLNFPGMVSLVNVDDLSEALANCIGNDDILNKTYFAETESLSLGGVLRIIFEKVRGGELRQIKVPKFKIIGWIHNLLPLTISNLFIDYLRAEDSDFKKDFKLEHIKRLVETVGDIVFSNIHNAGHWIVTGANSGIGFALADQLRQSGKKTILIDKDTGNIRDFDGIILQTDLSDRNSLYDLGLKLDKYKIFRLINNAGVGFKKDFLSMEAGEIVKTVEVNVLAPLLLTKFLAGNIIKNEGTIVNIASSAAFNPLPGMSLYAASKSLILNWSYSLWYEMKGKCNVLTFSPSGTRTNFQKQAGVAVTDDLLSPDHVAKEIIKMIEKKKSFAFLGFKNKIVSRITKFFPEKLNVIFWGEVFKKMR